MPPLPYLYFQPRRRRRCVGCGRTPRQPSPQEWPLETTTSIQRMARCDHGIGCRRPPAPEGQRLTNFATAAGSKRLVKLCMLLFLQRWRSQNLHTRHRERATARKSQSPSGWDRTARHCDACPHKTTQNRKRHFSEQVSNITHAHLEAEEQHIDVVERPRKVTLFLGVSRRTTVGLRDTQPIQPHRVHLRVSIDKSLDLRELLIVRIWMRWAQPPVTHHHRGGHPPMRKNVMQGHLTLEQEPALTQILVPQHTSWKVWEVQKFSARYEKKATNQPSASASLMVFPESVVPSALWALHCHLLLALADPVVERIAFLLCLGNRVLQG